MSGWVVPSSLIGVLLFTGLGVVHTKHQIRERQQQLLALERLQGEEQVRWSKLTLEIEAWSTNHEVDKLARRHLGMRLPMTHEVEVLVR